MRTDWKGVGDTWTIGLEIAFSIALGSFVGYKADAYFHTAPYLLILGFAFGLGAAVKALMRTLRTMQAIAREEERKFGNPEPLFSKYEQPKDEPSEENKDAESSSR